MKQLAQVKDFDDEGLARIGRDPRQPTDAETAPPVRVGGMTRDPRTERRARARVMKRLNRETAAAEQIAALPGPGRDVVLILTGNWHGFDLVGAVLQLAGGVAIEHLRLATLGFNRSQSDHLADLMDADQVRAVTFMLSEYFYNANAGEYAYLEQVLTSRGQRIAARRNHAKLLLFELADGRKLAAHGSLNLRRCNAWEQLVISHDPALHDWFADWIDEVIELGTSP